MFEKFLFYSKSYDVSKKKLEMIKVTERVFMKNLEYRNDEIIFTKIKLPVHFRLTRVDDPIDKAIG